MRSMTIGEFATRSRLSAKALRLYDQLGLLHPDHVDPVNGYRIYGGGAGRRRPTDRLAAPPPDAADDHRRGRLGRAGGGSVDRVGLLVARDSRDGEASAARGLPPGSPPRRSTDRVRDRDPLHPQRRRAVRQPAPRLRRDRPVLRPSVARVRAGGAGLAGIAGAPYLARGVGRGARARRGRTAAPGPHRRPTDGVAGDAGLRPDHPVATATADRGPTCGVMFRMRRPGPADLALPT